MTSTGPQNKTTAYWQALDREHHVHPFTNQDTPTQVGENGGAIIPH